MHVSEGLIFSLRRVASPFYEKIDTLDDKCVKGDFTGWSAVSGGSASKIPTYLTKE